MHERGAALILVLLLLVLMSALGLGLSLLVSTETLVAANSRESQQAYYLAEAALARAASDLGRMADWTPALSGDQRSSFADGEPGGQRTLPSGERLDLSAEANLASCGKPACTEADLASVTAERPWGANNPRFRPFAYGSASDLLAGAGGNMPYYVLVLIADDRSETDGDPLRDATAPDAAGRGVVLLRAKAFGPRGTRRALEVTLARSGGPPAERGYSGQLSGSATNERQSGRLVGTPGTTLQVTDIGG